MQNPMDSNDKRMRNQITAHPIQKKCRGYIKYNELLPEYNCYYKYTNANETGRVEKNNNEV